MTKKRSTILLENGKLLGLYLEKDNRKLCSLDAACGCLAAKFASSVHTLLVDILRCGRLQIKRKYWKQIYCSQIWIHHTIWIM